MSGKEVRATRERIVWRPEWTPSIDGWTKNFIHENKWRCDRVHSFNDLLQDARLLFFTLAEKYPGVIEPQHFMALYKTSIRNAIHDQSRYKRRKDVLMQDTSCDAADLFSGRIGDTTNAGYVSALLRELPDELKLVVKTLTEGKVRLKINKDRRDRPFRERQNLNQKLCQKLGLETKDPIGDLKRYLTT